MSEQGEWSHDPDIPVEVRLQCFVLVVHFFYYARAVSCKTGNKHSICPWGAHTTSFRNLGALFHLLILSGLLVTRGAPFKGPLKTGLNIILSFSENYNAKLAILTTSRYPGDV